MKQDELRNTLALQLATLKANLDAVPLEILKQNIKNLIISCAVILPAQSLPISKKLSFMGCVSKRICLIQYSHISKRQSNSPLS